MRLHPSVIAFSYTGFVFFGGFWNWVFRGYNNTVFAAFVSAGAMLIPSLLCLAISQRRHLGLEGVYLGIVLFAIISGIYTWRAYLAFFEQSNVPKTVLIAVQVLLGFAACVLLLLNRNYAPTTESAASPRTR